MRNFEYLGTAIKYPITIVNGKPALVNADENIKQSILQILSTPQGHRLMLPEYGSRLEEMVFEQNDDILKNMVRLFIMEALSTWEKRIKFKNVSFEQENDVILCEISYLILASNEIDSFVYPFYKKLIH